MFRVVLLCLTTLGVYGHSISFFNSGNDLEIRKYRFSRHVDKGFERLVLEFDHFATDGTKPELKVNSQLQDAKISVNAAHLSGIIPESEINRTYLSKSRLLGPLTISAEKGAFEILANFKKGAMVEAFWLDKPARLVVDVFAKDSVAFKAKRTKKPSRMTAGKIEPSFIRTEPKKSAEVKLPPPEYYCFPATSQMEARVIYGSNKATESFNSGGNEEGSAPESNVVCFPADSRLTPQITYKQAPYPSASGPISIQTDIVGGSQKIAFPETSPTLSFPSTVTTPFEGPMLSVPEPNSILGSPETPSEFKPKKKKKKVAKETIPPDVAAPTNALSAPSASVDSKPYPTEWTREPASTTPGTNYAPQILEPAKEPALPSAFAPMTPESSAETKPSAFAPQIPPDSSVPPLSDSQPEGRPLSSLPSQTELKTVIPSEPPPAEPAAPALLPSIPEEVIQSALNNAEPAATAVEEAPKDPSNPFPMAKKKKKKSKPRLPQLPPSITEGALLPPVK